MEMDLEFQENAFDELLNDLADGSYADFLGRNCLLYNYTIIA
jgi:hypothetical protein